MKGRINNDKSITNAVPVELTQNMEKIMSPKMQVKDRFIVKHVTVLYPGTIYIYRCHRKCIGALTLKRNVLGFIGTQCLFETLHLLIFRPSLHQVSKQSRRLFEREVYLSKYICIVVNEHEHTHTHSQILALTYTIFGETCCADFIFIQCVPYTIKICK